MKVNPKENVYFAVKLVLSLAIYGLLIMGIINVFSSNDPQVSGIQVVIITYAIILFLLYIFSLGILVGQIKGNAIKITPKQFPDIYDIIVKQSQTLGLKRIPDSFVWQRGGLLNAFTMRFVRTNYVVIFSDVLAEAYKKDTDTVAFVIGHEMGHIKRNHAIKKVITIPASFIPFLGAAYSRACEYTADNSGGYLSPNGAVAGMMLLAAGPHLTAKADAVQFGLQKETETGFWHWFAEKVASHPTLSKRVVALNAQYPEKPKKSTRAIYTPGETTEPENATTDHSKYMPN